MTTIADKGGIPEDLLGSPAAQKAGNRQLGQEEFLKLMVTQLNNQDPLKPMKSGEFLGQIAQFGTVSGIQDLQEVITDIRSTMAADRSIRAASLLGRDVLVADNGGVLPAEGPLQGAVELEGLTGEVSVEVLDSGGARVDVLRLGNLGAGLHDFSWDGTGPDGNRLPAGTYRLRAIAGTGDGNEAVPTFVNNRVTGVRIEPQNGELQLELAGRGSIGIDNVRRID